MNLSREFRCTSSVLLTSVFFLQESLGFQRSCHLSSDLAGTFPVFKFCISSDHAWFAASGPFSYSELRRFLYRTRSRPEFERISRTFCTLLRYFCTLSIFSFLVLNEVIFSFGAKTGIKDFEFFWKSWEGKSPPKMKIELTNEICLSIF